MPPPENKIEIWGYKGGETCYNILYEHGDFEMDEEFWDSGERVPKGLREGFAGASVSGCKECQLGF